MSVPNLKVAKIINEYLPNYGGQFDTSEHILATGDLSGPGILIFKEAADNGHLDIELTDIPLKYPEYVKFATENFLINNTTTNKLFFENYKEFSKYYRLDMENPSELT